MQNQVLHLDSDDDEILESTTIGSPVNMGEKEGYFFIKILL